MKRVIIIFMGIMSLHCLCAAEKEKLKLPEIKPRSLQKDVPPSFVAPEHCRAKIVLPLDSGIGSIPFVRSASSISSSLQESKQKLPLQIQKRSSCLVAAGSAIIGAPLT